MLKDGLRLRHSDFPGRQRYRTMRSRLNLPGIHLVLCVASLFAFLSVFPIADSSAVTMEEIKKNGVLRHLGIPYANFVTGSGDGMDVELMSLFAERLGVRYEFVRTDWDRIFTDLTGKTFTRDDRNDLITGDAPVNGDVAASGITVLPWREALVDFSLPVFPTQVWLMARADSPVKPVKPTGDLRRDIALTKKLVRGYSIMGKTGTCLDPALYGLERMTDRVRSYGGSLNEIAPALMEGVADLVLLDVSDALVALQKWPGRIKVLGPVSPMQDMAVAFRKDSPELRDEFNRFLADCRRNGTYTRIVKKYYPFVFEYHPGFFRKR
jgi:ABC-type amino acid transport substrate-binding protein